MKLRPTLPSSGLAYGHPLQSNVGLTIPSSHKFQLEFDSASITNRRPQTSKSRQTHNTKRNFMEVVLFILFILVGLIIYGILRSSQRAELVKEGKADYFVKVAASGKGSVYHGMNCRKCIAWHEMTSSEAMRRGYPPCATCGGRGQFRLL